MSAPLKYNLKIYQGSTFREVVRWEVDTKSYAVITAISKTAPVVITSVGHNMPRGWRFKVAGVIGMKEINSTEEFYVSDGTSTADTVVINLVNATGYSTYTGGGVLEYNTPVSLVGVTARMQIRPSITSTIVLEELTTENGKIVIDTAAKTITLVLDAETTALYDFTGAVYSLEVVNLNGEVTRLMYGNISLDKEITK